MKKLLYVGLFALFLGILPQDTPAAPTPEEAYFVGKPLMVVRFNQPNVYYQLPLYRAVKKTLQIYPNASFQVVSVFPTSGDYKTDEASAQTASDYAGLVVTALDDMGLPSTRYRTNYTSDSTADYHEIHIFVR